MRTPPRVTMVAVATAIVSAIPSVAFAGSPGSAASPGWAGSPGSAASPGWAGSPGSAGSAGSVGWAGSAATADLPSAKLAIEAGPSSTTAALAELRRGREAMLTTAETPYAGLIPWQSVKPDRIQAVAEPWDEVGHVCSVGSYGQDGGLAFRQRWLVSETATTYDLSVAQDVVLFPNTAAAAAAYARMADELATCQQRLQESGSDIVVSHVGDLSDGAGQGTVWNADFPFWEPQFLDDVTMATAVRGRAVTVVSISRYGSLTSYDPASALPTAQAALTRLAVVAQ